MVIAEVTWVEGGISIVLGFFLFVVIFGIIASIHKPRLTEWEREQHEIAEIQSKYMQ